MLRRSVSTVVTLIAGEGQYMVFSICNSSSDFLFAGEDLPLPSEAITPEKDSFFFSPLVQ